MDYIIVFLLNLLLMFHIPPSTPIESFVHGLIIAVVYMLIKQLILKKEQWER